MGNVLDLGKIVALAEIGSITRSHLKCPQFALWRPRRTTYIDILTCPVPLRVLFFLPFLLAGKGQEEDRTEGASRRRNALLARMLIARTQHCDNIILREHRDKKHRVARTQDGDQGLITATKV
jgi:hypothetical protein